MATKRIRHQAPQIAQGSVSQTVTDWLVARACKGVPPFESAATLAAPYQKPGAYPTPEAAARALVQSEMGKTFGAGFVMGLGGFVALPVALPAGMATSPLLQARMVAAIAILFGHDPAHPGVHTSILLSLEAGFAPEGVRRIGTKLGKWAAARTLGKVTPEALLQINERIGANLLRRVGRNKWGVFGRAVPVVGAMVAGGMDAYGCRQVAREAISLFSRPDAATLGADADDDLDVDEVLALGPR